MKKKPPPSELPRPEEGATPRALVPIHPRPLGAAPVLNEAPARRPRTLLIGALAMASLAAAASFALYTSRAEAVARANEADWSTRAKRLLPAVGDEQHIDGAMRPIRVPGGP